MFEAKNELETKLIQAQNGELEPHVFMQDLLATEVFMPVRDEDNIGGFQRSQQAQPLSLKDENGEQVLIIFSSPERAKEFVRDYPGYGGGLLVEFKWILEKLGTGFGISLNPGWTVGLDLESQALQQIAAQMS